MTKLMDEIIAVLVGGLLVAVLLVSMFSRDVTFYPMDGGVPACISRELSSIEEYRITDEQDYLEVEEHCIKEQEQKR